MRRCQHCGDQKLGITYTISEEWLCLSCDKKREQTLREERLASERAKSAESDVTSPNNTLMTSHSPTAETTDPGERQHVTSAESGSVPSHLSAAQDGDDVAKSSTRQRHSHCDTAPPASQHAEAPEHCIPGCKHRKGKGGGDMLRCCLCGKWYHIKCLELTKDEIAGVWPCMTCRHLSDDVRSVNLKIDQLSSDMERVLVLLSSSLKEIQKQRDDTLNECSTLRTENVQLREQNAALSRENSRLVYDIKRTQQKQSNGKTLIIGSSIIRNLDPASMTNTDVVCMRSAKIADINGELKEIKRTCPNRYEHAILVCGGNDCAVADPQMNAIAESYKDLITTAQTTAHKVTVSSVPPRLKPQHAPDAISSLNAALQEMTVDMSVSFANNHDLFHLQNGDINDGYLHNDKIHLNQSGADALVKSIGIKLKHGCETATSSHPKQSNALTWGNRTVHPGSKRGPGPSHNHVNETENNTNESMEHEQYKSAFFKTARNKAGYHPMKYGQKRNDLMRSRGGEIDTHQVSNRRANFGNGQGNGPRSTNFPCVYCAEPNHRAQNCRHGQAILCHSCNRLGHKSKYCSWGSNGVNHENTTNGRLPSAYWEHANEGSAHRQGLLTETDKENKVCHNVLNKHKCEYFKKDFLSYTNPFIFMSPAFNACTCTGGEMKSLDCKQMNCIRLSVEKALENSELWTTFTIARSPADGHCFVHSLIRALRDQHPDSTMVNYAEVLRLIVDETKRNILSYTAFNIDQTQKRVLDEMERYIRYKIYDSKYGDMVPLIASTALSLNVFIISKQGNGHDVFHVKPMSSDDHTKASILLYKEGEHYDAIVPLEKHYDQKCLQNKNHIKSVFKYVRWYKYIL